MVNSPLFLALTYIVPAASSVAACAVVGMKVKKLFPATREFLMVVLAALAVKVAVPVLFKFPRMI
jgi:hypothetical protein